MFEGFVLIGGESSRMKIDKAALRVGDATFAERAAAALEKIAARRVSFIVGTNRANAARNFLPRGVPLLNDALPHKAALGGIYTALLHATSEWAAILACDFPFVTADFLIRLAQIAEAGDEKIAAVVPVQPDGRVQPLCALYRVSSCLPETKRLLNADKIPPARRLLENVETRLVEFSELSNLRGAENFFVNVNTPEDYIHALSIFQKV